MLYEVITLLRLTNDETLVEQLKSDWRKAPLDEMDQAMLVYAEKLTLRPWEMVDADVEARNNFV